VSTSPTVSIAIACVNGLPYIEECLRSFERQRGGISYEVIVADRCNRGCREAVRRHPNVRLIEVDRPGATVPELRAIAIREARGELLAITEDHCIAPENWLATMVQAHDERRQIVGGPIDNAATRRLIDWAVFLCEYSAFTPPLAAGRGPVPGNNTSYDRGLVALIDDLLEAGVWEEEFNTRLATHGHDTYVEPDAVMLHKKSFGLREFVAQRYYYARSYAGLRVRNASLWRRVLYAGFAGTILPPLLLGRMARNVWTKGSHRREFVLSLPLLAVFVTTTGWAELVGYLLGPGDSLRRVE
jgi:GT2 family glycosyltransferase